MRRNKLQLFLVVLLLNLLFCHITVSAQTQALGERFEQNLGDGAVPEILKQYGGEYILPIDQRLWVEEIFRRLVGVTSRLELEYTLTVLNSTELNAFALPGGYVFITKGLLKTIDGNEAKLAAVLGHELAHIEKKHGINAVLRQMGLAVLLEVGVMVLDLASGDMLRLANATLLQLLKLGWGREAEYEADLLGQTLAVNAGFDGVGAIDLLEDLLAENIEDLPMKIFRTHPDTNKRRERLQENLATFWTTPVVVKDVNLLEKLNSSRNYDQSRRTDPNGRYLLAISEEAGLKVSDLQTKAQTTWLPDAQVHDFVWSPQGQYLAVIINEESTNQVWICDRFGYIVREIDIPEGTITDFSWSPQRNQLALIVKGLSCDIVLVTYVETEVIFSVNKNFGGDRGVWLESGLYFSSSGKWYYTSGPKVEPVVIPNPVPRVLQRQRVLSPTVIKDGTTIRLTRPSLAIP